MSLKTDDSVRWRRRAGAWSAPREGAWGTHPRRPGAKTPETMRGLRWLGPLVAASAVGCSNQAEQQTYDPISLGMVASDAPAYVDGDTQIFAVKRPVSLPVLAPNDAQRAM